MPAVWPFNSKALATSRKSPFLPKHTSHTFTSGVKPQDATNLGEQTSRDAGHLLQSTYSVQAVGPALQSSPLATRARQGPGAALPGRGAPKTGLCEGKAI